MNLKTNPELLPLIEWWEKEGKQTVIWLLVAAIAVGGWYGWKNHKFGEHYGIYWIASGLAIVLLVIHVFKREQYQNLMPIVAGDVIIILTFVMAGIIGYKQKS